MKRSELKKIVIEEISKLKLNEAFKSQKIRDLLNLVGGSSKYGSDLIGRIKLPIQWSEVEDDYIMHMSASAAQKYMNNENHIIFWVVDNDKEVTNKAYTPPMQSRRGYVIGGGSKTITLRKGLIAATKGKTILSFNGTYNTWKREAGMGTSTAIMKLADSAYVLNTYELKQKYSSADKTTARSEAKRGALALADLKTIRNANLARYKEAVRNKLLRQTPIDVLVKELFTDLNNIITRAIEKPEFGEYEKVIVPGWPSNWSSNPAQVISDFKGVMEKYEEYLTAVRRIEKMKNNPEIDASEIRYYEKELKYHIATVLERIREFRANVNKMKEFQK